MYSVIKKHHLMVRAPRSSSPREWTKTEPTQHGLPGTVGPRGGIVPAQARIVAGGRHRATPSQSPVAISCTFALSCSNCVSLNLSENLGKHGERVKKTLSDAICRVQDTF